MKVFPSLHGNAFLKNLIGNDVAAGNQAHAYVLEGPDGSGRHTAAAAIAAAVLCENRGRSDTLPCGTCPSCRKMARHLYPDYKIVGAEGKSSIGVDAIRQIKNELYIPPNDGDCKFYVIEDADAMSLAAQNSLLLSLEEPPAFVMFLLLVKDAGKLLETVRSRAPVIKMQVFTPDELAAYLPNCPALDGTPSQAEIENAAFLSGGSVGTALALLSEKRDMTDGLLYRTLGGRVAQQVMAGNVRDGAALLSELCRDMGKKRDELSEVLRMALVAVRDCLAEKKTEEPELLFYRCADEIPERARTLSVPRILSASDKLIRAMDDLSINANVNLTLTALLLSHQA